MNIIPTTNPHAGYLAHKTAIDEAVNRVLQSGWYILGKETEAFENEFANYLDVSEAIGVGNGTDALHLALRASDIGAGDLVLTVSNTAVATVAAIEMAGAHPVFVDIDPQTYTMDTARLESVIDRLKKAAGQRLKAIVPVHLYGHPADMPAILQIAAHHRLIVIEDCAQAHGATIDGKKAGTFGDMGTFSFYPTKNLGALGDGGAIVCHNRKSADKVRRLRQYGWNQKRLSLQPGINSRLDEIQAAILRVKLKHLDHDNAKRRAIADCYLKGLSGSILTLPACRPGYGHVYHLFVIRHPNRNALKTALQAKGVSTQIHYPVPIHAHPAYRKRLKPVFPLIESERAAKEILSLPLFPELNPEAYQKVIEFLLDTIHEEQ